MECNSKERDTVFRFYGIHLFRVAYMRSGHVNLDTLRNGQLMSTISVFNDRTIYCFAIKNAFAASEGQN